MASLQFDRTRKQFVIAGVDLPDSPTKIRLPRGTSKAEAEDALTQIKTRELGRRLGTVDDASERLRAHRAAPIEEHVAAFEKALLAKGNKEKHVNETVAELRRVVAGCGYATITDLEDLSRLDAYRADLRAKGRGERTCGKPLVVVKQFCRWLVTSNRATRDPYCGIKGPSEATDRLHARRALTPARAGQAPRPMFQRSARKKTLGWLGQGTNQHQHRTNEHPDENSAYDEGPVLLSHTFCQHQEPGEGRERHDNADENAREK